MTLQEDGAFAVLTEAPGRHVSVEGADMLFSRYTYGAEVGAGGRLLEIGCGPGVGLGLLSSSASHLFFRTSPDTRLFSNAPVGSSALA